MSYNEKIEIMSLEQIKMIVWQVFAGSKGCINRVKILFQIKKKSLIEIWSQFGKIIINFEIGYFCMSKFITFPLSDHLIRFSYWCANKAPKAYQLNETDLFLVATIIRKL